MTVMEQARAIRSAMDRAASVLTDGEALESIGIYPRWEELVRTGRTGAQGFRFRHGQKLYRLLQPAYTFTEVYVPGAGTESLFGRIDPTHMGTLEDPIPYESGMALEEGRYYSQDGAVYLCSRATQIPVYAPLAELVGLYVEVL